MRKYCWVYQNKHTGDLILAKRPHRREYKPRYRMFFGYFVRNGFRPYDFYIHFGSIGSGIFRQHYSYVGRF